MRSRLSSTCKAVLRHLRDYGRLDFLIAAVMMLAVTGMLVWLGGPVDYWTIGEPYTVEGTLWDCYIEDDRLGKYYTQILRIVVDGEEYTIWDEYMGMDIYDFRQRMHGHVGETATMQCVDSSGYDRHVAGLAFGDTVYFQVEDSLAFRRQNSSELGWIGLIMGLTGLVFLVLSTGVVFKGEKNPPIHKLTKIEGMEIYDRYYGDSAQARERYRKEEVNARFNALQKNRFLMGGVLGGLALLELVIICVWGSDPDLRIVEILLPVLMGILFLCFQGERQRCDAWIYGMKDGDFLMLNTLYEVIRRIAPGNVQEIRILPACRPDTRTIREGGKHERRTRLEPMLESQKRQYHADYAYHPMAVLYTGEKNVDWNRFEDAVLFREQKSGLHKLLQRQLVIVPHGENFAPFIQLLRNSTCPVIISCRMYDLHEGLMVQLFAHSGMDMNRLRIEEE